MKIWSMPVTTNVIQQVHILSRMGDMPKGLKINNKTGLDLYDASMIAKVDYVEDTDQDDNESDKSETGSKTESDDDNSESREIFTEVINTLI